MIYVALLLSSLQILTNLQHTLTRKHRRFAANSTNWAELDALLSEIQRPLKGEYEYDEQICCFSQHPMISFGPRPLSDTTSHPGAGQAFIFQLSFFCTLQFLFPSCLIRISPDSDLKTSHNHTLGIDTCMVAFFFSFIFLIYHASAVPVTSPSPTV